MVSLGDKAPAWGLSRWASGGLRFIPPDDEGFILRGDNRRLVYRGRKRSHRFTILGDTSFEYDCILNREPESNVITLLMEGAENFDFFRQPDFVKNSFLKGSYAVYKKEILVGEGTGKLCHIHRPLIIDSRGRRCWGDLSVTGDKLCITIPEAWLSEAEYPVLVDPAIGTTTVGSQTTWEQDPDEWVPLYNEMCIPVNRFLVNETINGLCTAYFYVYNSKERESAGYPVFYSDNNNSALCRRSAQESFIDLRVTGGSPEGWRSGTLRSGESIGAGSYIWFGISTEYFWYARFDYGSKFLNRDNSDEPLPDMYALDYIDSPLNFKLSMYFSYSSAQSYVRTLTQGIALTDTGKLAGNYQRNVEQTAGGITTINRFVGLYRSIVQTVKNTVTLKGSPTLIVRLAEGIMALYGMKTEAGFNRGVTDTGNNYSALHGMVTFFRVLLGLAGVGDSTGGLVTRIRIIQDTKTIGDDMGHVADYLRGLFVEAGSMAETKHEGDYHRRVTDTAHNEAIPLRHLFIFLRLLTAAYIRDYIIGRFLRSKEEVVIKSPVCREIILESTLH
jgi:hypothetical protein